MSGFRAVESDYFIEPRWVWRCHKQGHRFFHKVLNGTKVNREYAVAIAFNQTWSANRVLLSQWIYGIQSVASRINGSPVGF